MYSGIGLFRSNECITYQNRLMTCKVFSFIPAVSLAADVIQKPKLHLAQSMDNISLTCEHDDSSHYRKFWYRKCMGKELELLGYTAHKDKALMEKGFQDGRITINPESIERSILVISTATVEDNALYYCASSIHSEERLQIECAKGSSPIYCNMKYDRKPMY